MSDIDEGGIRPVNLSGVVALMGAEVEAAALAMSEKDAIIALLLEALKEARDMVNVFEQITPYTDPRSQVLKAVLARVDAAIAAATRET